MPVSQTESKADYVVIVDNHSGGSTFAGCRVARPDFPAKY